MPVSTIAGAKKIEFHGLTARPIAVPSRGTAELAIWHLDVDPGVRGEEHTVDHEEVFVIKAGRLRGTLGGEPCEAGPGDALIVPPGVPFALGNDGDETASAVVCTSAGVRANLNGATIVPPWSE
ncbi:cupin domain-containing protein [Actinomadura sp. DC4]|uniref:cupin domain-containing protein n=1 Tax=Actinomadura sp. DC4 TaxID=3055069 RepID=UPI0025B20BCD|nr:cupin domain-containing protein [Actinomadura sp. DC4]MDN3356614.1 cupin domain-containing protein [Actinomadura sp. DC4]